VLVVWLAAFSAAGAGPARPAGCVPLGRRVLAAPDTGWRVLPSSRFEVTTRARGFLAALSHQHRVVAGTFHAYLAYDSADPSRDSVAVVVAVDSLRVRTADASPAQLHAIRQHMLRDVLHPDRHPTIRFTSRRVEPTGGGVRIQGELTLEDSTRAVTLSATLDARGDTLVARGTFPLRQTDYGIRPYSFGLGAIEVADEMTMSFEVKAVRRRS